MLLQKEIYGVYYNIHTHFLEDVHEVAESQLLVQQNELEGPGNKQNSNNQILAKKTFDNYLAIFF